MKTLKISEVFSNSPGGRLRKNGPFSGEEFRESILIPELKKLAPSEKILIDLDGGFGYASSFLDEVFGGVYKQLGEQILNKLIFKSDEEPSLLIDIHHYTVGKEQEKYINKFWYFWINLFTIKPKYCKKIRINEIYEKKKGKWVEFNKIVGTWY